MIYAQNEIIIENIIENIGDETYSAPDIDLIEYYREYPLNLRDVSIDELAGLPGISQISARQIIELVRNNPDIKNHKIADIVGLSPEVEILLDVCTVNMPPQKNKHRQGFITRSRLKQRFEDVRGISENKYLGSKEDVYNRFIAYYSDYEICGIINKHSGEQSLAEYSSGYAQFNDGRNKIVAGDFYADYGMGAVLWRQFASRKGSEVISPVINIGNGIAPYRSTLDFAHFRGVSAQTIQNINDDISIRLSGFYSNRDKSASLDSATNEITSVYSAGYYRTESEINKKNILNETAIGGNLEINTIGGLIVGTSALSLNYSHTINSQSSSAFSGKDGTLLSAYSAYSFANNMFGSEFALDAQANKLFRGGFVHSSKYFELAVSGRYIEQNFRSPYGFHFGEFSFPANEQGIYTGLLFKPSQKVKVSFFGDIFSSIGRTFTVPGKVRGMDLFTGLIYTPERNTNYIIRLRRDNKNESIIGDDDERLIGQGIKNSLRLEFSTEPVKNLTTRFRVELADYQNEMNVDNGSGILTFIDLRWKANEKLKLGGRYTLFSSDNFSSAIYQFEYTMPGSMVTSALFGRGSRFILTAEYRPFEFMRIYANYVTTIKNDVSTIGSGNEMINNNHDSRAVLQIEFRY